MLGKCDPTLMLPARPICCNLPSCRTRTPRFRRRPRTIVSRSLLGRSGWRRDSISRRWPGTPTCRSGFPSARSAASGSAPPTSSMPARSSRASRRRWSCSPPIRRERPLFVQIFGANVEEMTGAARWLVERGLADGIDINMGCPVRKVVRTGGGSSMLCDTTGTTVDLVRKVVESVPVPVSVKMRLGWDDDNLTAPYFAREFEKVGCRGHHHPRPHPRAGLRAAASTTTAFAAWSRRSSGSRCSATATCGRSPTRRG